LAKERYEDETAWVQRTSEETGWPHAIVAYADFGVEDVRPQLDRLKRYPLVRGVRMQLALAPEPLYRFAPRADLCADPTLRRNIARLADYGWSFELQVFAPQMPDAANLAEACPKGHVRAAARRNAGGPVPCGRSAWRAGMVRLRRVRTSSASSPGGHVHHRNDPAHIAGIVSENGGDLRGRSLPVRFEFSNREAVDRLWRSHRRLSRHRQNEPAPSRRDPAR